MLCGDDTSGVIRHKSVNITEKLTTNTILTLQSQFYGNKHSLNIDKSVSINFTKRERHELKKT